MEFLQLVDFTFVGLVICLLIELFNKAFEDYFSALKKGSLDLSIYKIMWGLFYIGFTIYLLWTPLWLGGLMLIVLGFLMSGATKPITRRIKETLSTGVPGTYLPIIQLKDILRTYFFLDIIISVLLLSWMLYSHSINLGIIS